MIGEVLRVRYEVAEELSSGSLFEVFRCLDRVTGREVCVRALQEPFAHEPAFVERLKQAAQIANASGSATIEKLIELDDHEGRLLIITELAPGQPLSEKLKRLAPFSAQAAVATAIGVAEGLEALHAHGIVHGDVSAKNILVAADGRVKLTLPGLWQSFSASKTAGSVVLPGLAPYLAPEITSGEMPSPGGDVYALSVVIYEMLTGRLPYSADTAVAMALKHATAPVPSVRTQNPSVPMVLEEIVKKAMAKSPSDRYASAKELLSDLRILQDALRFGKSLTWPISVAPAVAPAAVAEEPVTLAKQPVAPRMGAIKQRREREEADTDLSESLPAWLVTTGYVCVLALVVMIGGFVYWNLTKPRTLSLPNLLGRNAAEASTALNRMGLTLKVGRREFSEDQPEGTIITTNPPPGKAVREKTTVFATVSSGPLFVELPDLRGQTVEEAKRALAKLELTLVEPVRQVRNRQVEEGTIVAQVPEPRKKVERYTRIRVDVASNVGRGDSDRDANRNFDYTLRVSMPAEYEMPVLVRVEMTDSQETLTVYEESHVGGETFTVEATGKGRDAIFRVFFDGELVKQVKGNASERSERDDET